MPWSNPSPNIVASIPPPPLTIADYSITIPVNIPNSTTGTYTISNIPYIGYPGSGVCSTAFSVALIQPFVNGTPVGPGGSTLSVPTKLLHISKIFGTTTIYSLTGTIGLPGSIPFTTSNPTIPYDADAEIALQLSVTNGSYVSPITQLAITNLNYAETG